MTIFLPANRSDATSSTRFPIFQILAMSAEAPTQTPTIERESQTIDERDTDPTHRVILYDDDWHGMDEVVLQIQKATGYDLERAMEIMLEAHAKGRAICFRGARDKCHRVAGVLRQIQLQVEVDCD